MSNSALEGNTKQEKTIKEVIQPYSKHWKWFIIALITTVLLALVYLKFFATTIYQVRSSVLIKDSKNSPDIPGGMGVLQGLSSIGGMGTNSIENEIEVFKSKNLMRDVVEKLQLPVKIYSKEGFKKRELYSDISPIIIRVVNEKPFVKLPKEPIQLQIKGDQITLSSEEIKDPIKSAFNRIISLPYANIIILKNPDFNSLKAEEIGDLCFSYTTKELATNEYQKMLDVELLDKDGTVIGLGVKHPNTDKAKRILGELIKAYNIEAINDKNLESQKTNDFLANKLDTIALELASAEKQKQEFKTINEIVDIPTEARIGLESSVGAKRQQVEIESQLQLTNMVIGYLSKQGNGQVLPTNFGINSGEVSESIVQYNMLVMERNGLLENATLQNPLVVDLDKKISALRNSVMQSLKKNSEALQVARNKVLKAQGEASEQISKIPGQEKIYRGIERQLNVKEQLYLLLLEKKEEAEIALSIASNKARIVDDPYVEKEPVAPKKIFIGLGAVLLGLFIPFGFIYANDLFDDKIKSKKDIESMSQISVLGEIPTNGKKDDDLVKPNDLSPTAEAFRIIITNLNYTLPKTEKGKVIFVTSSVKGEGKTFVSANLALTLATPSRKTIIIGSDIRNPQLQRYNPARKGLNGLTEFLYNDKVTSQSIIHKSSYNEHLDVIYSGSVPPNPTDLLSNGRYSVLLDELKEKYDYIILDTAPLMLVTDTFLIAEEADATLYVVRSRESDKQLVEFANKNVESKKLKNVGFIINDVKKEDFGYGNKYGYGYSADDKTFLQKLRDRF